MKTLRIPTILGLVSLVLIPPVLAQTNDDEQVFELSPFEVDASQDHGYIASQTLSGTRFSTPLEDVAASVSVFTDAFIDDLAILDPEELTRYTLNQMVELGDRELGGVIDTPRAGAQYSVHRIRVRGLDMTQGVDYFKRIYSGDGYNIGRYDESRGPNGILFGVGGAGGITNSTSISSQLNTNFGRVRFTTETNGGYRAEARYNQSVIEDHLAVNIAVVNQELDGYKHHVWKDTQRFYGSMKWKINDHIAFRFNTETGTKNQSAENMGAIGSHGMMVWKDWSEAVGVENLVLPALNRNPTAEEYVYGLFNRNTNANGSNERFVYVINDGAFYNSAGSFQTVEYGSSPVRSPDGWAPPDDIANGSAANQRLKVFNPNVIDPKVSLTGPGQYRDEEFYSYTANLDISVTDNLFFNLAYNKQDIDIFAPTTQGFNWQVDVDPNTTRGVENYANGNPNPGYGGENPYGGGYMIHSNWGVDTSTVTQDTLRFTMSYSFDFTDTSLGWLGSHSFAAMAEKGEYDRLRSNKWFGFLGSPFSTNWNSSDNRLVMRYYFPIDDLIDNPDSVHLPDWSELNGESITYDGQTYEIGLYNRNPGANPNSQFMEKPSAYLGVLQSYFWDRKIITTLGYRKDEVDSTQYGYYTDPMYGPTPDTSIIGSEGNFSGETYTAGVVYRMLPQLDLVANYASNIGIPDTQQSVLPDGGPPPPPEGTGYDIGIQFRLLDDKIQGKFVFYDVLENDKIHGSGGPSVDLERITDGLGGQLISQGLYTDESWAAEMASRGMDQTWTASTHDRESNGWEFGLVANPTRNWRISMGVSKVDNRQFNRNNDVGIAYGFISVPGPEGAPYEQYIEGFDDATGVWRLQNASDFEPDGWASQLIELGQLIDSGEDNFETFGVWNGRSMSRIIGERVRNLNRNKRQSERRQGLRPYKANMFAAYEFFDGILEGLSIGAGFRWEDKAIIGLDPVTQNEVQGPDILKTNMMIRYSWDKEDGMFAGRWAAQLNIDNLLNDDDPLLINSHLYQDNVYIYDLPGDWGQASANAMLVQPISARISLTYEF